ncbi:MAG: hypothetical protein DRR19_04490, partial [Candidatus Parabeggiatoa sp. nov. 1]
MHGYKLRFLGSRVRGNDDQGCDGVSLEMRDPLAGMTGNEPLTKVQFVPVLSIDMLKRILSRQGIASVKWVDILKRILSRQGIASVKWADILKRI